MPKRDWLGDFIFALVALAALVAVVACATGIILSEYAKVHLSNAAYQQNAENDRYAANQEIANACGGLTGPEFSLCVSDKLESYYRDQATNEDLQAQQDMAFWAAALFISSTVLTAAGLLMIWRTLVHTRRAAEYAGAAVLEAKEATKAARDAVVATERIGEAQVRAYLSIVESSINVRADGSGVETRLEVKNFGNSPAKKVHIAYRIGIAVNPQNLRDNGPMVVPPWEHVFDETIASGTTRKFNHFHGDLPLAPDEMNAIQAQALPPMFYATMTIRFLDVFDRVNAETQHRTAMMQHTNADMPFFQTAFHPLSWRIDQEQAEAAQPNQ